MTFWSLGHLKWDCKYQMVFIMKGRKETLDLHSRLPRDYKGLNSQLLCGIVYCSFFEIVGVTKSGMIGGFSGGQKTNL